MTAMHCDRVSELIGAYLDQELDAELRRQVAMHLDGCPACSATVEDLRRLGAQLAVAGREPAPVHLVRDVRSLIATAAAGSTGPQDASPMQHPMSRRWLRQAAALLLACGVTAVIATTVALHVSGTAALERDVAAAHIRSLLQESPTQIASSEMHTVKPWFAGRLDFAPAVKDLTAEGFPLAGARLDYVGERRVAALVYRRRLHVVNVFLWPSSNASGSAPREITHKGYNVVTWTEGGITYWAISDLNMGELRQLQILL
jgi:anti-sigma factor RsiW